MPIFSGTKGMVAACLLVLLDRGALELERPVCHYWPEFAAAGKRRILVRDVVSHRAGLPGITTPVTTQEATDDRRMAALVAAQAPNTAPGRAFCYHAMTFGWICGERAPHRRAQHRPLLRRRLAAPLGLDAWIGLPEELEPRVARLERGRPFEMPIFDRRRDPVAWSIWSNPPRFTGGELPANSRAWHAAEIPATSGIATARSLARLCGCLAGGGEIDGVRLVSPAAVRRAGRCLVHAMEPYLQAPMAFGAGFQLQTGLRPFGPVAVALGHGGTGGSVHGAWPQLGVGFCYAMNLLRMPPPPDPRSAGLLAALHAAVVSSGRVRRRLPPP